MALETADAEYCLFCSGRSGCQTLARRSRHTQWGWQSGGIELLGWALRGAIAPYKSGDRTAPSINDTSQARQEEWASFPRAAPNIA